MEPSARASELLEHWEGEPVGRWRERWGVAFLEVHERIGSTNDRALELAARGRSTPGVVIAREQTRGRGRHGARWHSPAGSGLWMSILLPGRGAPEPHLSLLVGLAVAEAIEAVEVASRGASPRLRIGIKWPNDLFLRGRKVGGILCEWAGGAGVVGIGINVREPEGGFPEAIRPVATSLEAEGCKVLAHSTLAGAIVHGVEARCARPSAALSGPDLASLRARDILLGRAVHTEEQGPGRALGVDPEGALVLERADGSLARVRSGTVRPLG